MRKILAKVVRRSHLQGMAIIGYARVSTDGQSLVSQVAALKAAGAARIYRETVSGAKAERKELGRALKSIVASGRSTPVEGKALAFHPFDEMAIGAQGMIDIGERRVAPGRHLAAADSAVARRRGVSERADFEKAAWFARESEASPNGLTQYTSVASAIAARRPASWPAAGSVDRRLS